MVADLVDHGFLHLSDDLLLGLTQTQDRAAVDVNAIRQLSAGIKEGVAMDGATPVQPEQLVRVFRLKADCFERLRAGLLLDLDRHVVEVTAETLGQVLHGGDRKSTRLNSSHLVISYAVFCLKKKKAYRALIASQAALPHRRRGGVLR